VAGKDFCIVAADTRCSLGYFILSRDASKITKLTDKVVIATAGMRADIIGLHKKMQTSIKMYEYKFGKTPSIDACAQLLSNTLYGRRFFPFYTFNLLCGVNEAGEGSIFGYDAIGSYDRVNSGAMGSGSQLIVPILDNQFKDHNNMDPQAPDNIDEVTNVVRDTLHATAERDIYTGD
jgi:20S proteasome subunit beta 6